MCSASCSPACAHAPVACSAPPPPQTDGFISVATKGHVWQLHPVDKAELEVWLNILAVVVGQIVEANRPYAHISMDDMTGNCATVITPQYYKCCKFAVVRVQAAIRGFLEREHYLKYLAGKRARYLGSIVKDAGGREQGCGAMRVHTARAGGEGPGGAVV